VPEICSIVAGEILSARLVWFHRHGWNRRHHPALCTRPRSLVFRRLFDPRWCTVLAIIYAVKELNREFVRRVRVGFIWIKVRYLVVGTLWSQPICNWFESLWLRSIKLFLPSSLIPSKIFLTLTFCTVTLTFDLFDLVSDLGWQFEKIDFLSSLKKNFDLKKIPKSRAKIIFEKKYGPSDYRA